MKSRDETELCKIKDGQSLSTKSNLSRYQAQSSNPQILEFLCDFFWGILKKKAALNASEFVPLIDWLRELADGWKPVDRLDKHEILGSRIYP